MYLTKRQTDVLSLAIALTLAYILTAIFRMMFMEPVIHDAAQADISNKRGQYAYHIKADCAGRDNAAKRSGKPSGVTGPMLPETVMASSKKQFLAILQSQYAGCRYMTVKWPKGDG